MARHFFFSQFILRFVLFLYCLGLSLRAAGEPEQGAASSSRVPLIPVSLRLGMSTVDGFSAVVGLAAGEAGYALKLASEPESAPRIVAGVSSPLATAGPVRHTGLARLLSDPCADAYLFAGAWHRPLALDLESCRYGFSLGESAGIWAMDAEAPRMGIWAGSVGDDGLILGCAAACSLLPAREWEDSWFSGEPAVPRRLGAAGAIWTGCGFPWGKILAAAALSEEDRGERGWAARAEGEFHTKDLRWNGRFSFASPEWKGLNGEGADSWEARTDVSWLLPSRVRLCGRIRAGKSEDGVFDWESLVRAAWSGKAWRLQISLEGADSAYAPFVNLEPEFHAEYETKNLRAHARSSWTFQEGSLSGPELSAGLVLGGTGSFRLRLEGCGRWMAAEEFWKANVRCEIPAAAGIYTVSLGTEDWVERSEHPEWELSFSLRARVP